MKPRKPHNFVPPAGGGETFQILEAGPPVYHVPLPEKRTRLKYDKATGTFVIDPDRAPRPLADAAPDQPPAAE